MSAQLLPITLRIPPRAIVRIVCDCHCPCHGEIAGRPGPCLDTIEPDADDCRHECRTSAGPCDPFLSAAAKLARRRAGR